MTKLDAKKPIEVIQKREASLPRQIAYQTIANQPKYPLVEEVEGHLTNI